MANEEEKREMTQAGISTTVDAVVDADEAAADEAKGEDGCENEADGVRVPTVENDDETSRGINGTPQESAANTSTGRGSTENQKRNHKDAKKNRTCLLQNDWRENEQEM